MDGVDETLARVERHLQGAIIDHLAEIEARSLFLRRGFASLFEYAVRELGYSDAAAGRRIAAMRLCADNPHTRERLRDGSLSLSAAAELQWAFDRQRRRCPRSPARPACDTPRAATPQAATTPAVAARPTEPPLVLDAVWGGRSWSRRRPARARGRSSGCWPTWTRNWRRPPIACARSATAATS